MITIPTNLWILFWMFLPVSHAFTSCSHRNLLIRDIQYDKTNSATKSNKCLARQIIQRDAYVLAYSLGQTVCQAKTAERVIICTPVYMCPKNISETAATSFFQNITVCLGCKMFVLVKKNEFQLSSWPLWLYFPVISLTPSPTAQSRNVYVQIYRHFLSSSLKHGP